MTFPALVVFILAALALVGLGAISRAFMPRCKCCGFKHAPFQRCGTTQEHRAWFGSVRGSEFFVRAKGADGAEAAKNLQLVMTAIEEHPKLKHKLETRWAMDHAAADRLSMASILMLATLNKHGANRVKAEQELRAAGEAYDKFRGRP